MTVLARVALLVALWVLLWGDISVANVVAGALVAGALLALYPMRRQGRRGRTVRPVALVHLVGHVLVRFVVSNAVVAREIVTPGSRIRTGIVACPLRSGSSGITSFVANVLALSPGTMPVDVVADPPTLYVHVLHLRDPERTRREVATLESLAVGAFGSRADVTALRLGGSVAR
jgi:multicomponent Na+:H+ antiporter subunit E